MKRARPQGLGSAAKKKDKTEEEQLNEASFKSGETVASEGGAPISSFRMLRHC